MTDTPPPAAPGAVTTPQDRAAALFATLILQQANMALIFLGQSPHPEDGKTEIDLDGAQMFIDTLEMLAVKTKGNLNPREEQLLQQNLTALRMAFVEAVNTQAAAGGAPAAAAPPAASAAQATPAPDSPGAATAEESRKKFSKKY